MSTLESTSRMLSLGDGALRADMLTQLQATAGNAAVQRLLASGPMAPPRPRPLQRCAGGCDDASEEREDRQPVQRVAGGDTAPASVPREVETARGSGRALDAATRQKIEPTLGADLSTLRVHDDARSDRLARRLDAEAFTTGHDVFFRGGTYDPSSRRGLHTIAHESAHVAQQSRAGTTGSADGGMTVSDPGDRSEHEADVLAQRVLDGDGPVALEPRRPTPSLQRLATPSARHLHIQRKPHGADPLGTTTVSWDPKATFDFSSATGGPGSRSEDIGESDQATFTDIPRDAEGDFTMPVNAKWGGGSGPGPVPPKPPGCDVCKVLQEAASQGVASFVDDVISEALPPILGFLVGKLARVLVLPVQELLGAAVSILPSDLVRRCQNVDVDEAIAELQALKDKFDSGICDVILDEGTGHDVCEVIDTIVQVLRFTPLAPIALTADQIKKGVLTTFSKGIGSTIKELKKIRGKCGKTGPPSVTAPAKGEATTTLKLHVFTQADGTMRVVGPSPQVLVNGTGVVLHTPVESTKDPTGQGAHITQSPLLKTTDGTGQVSRIFVVKLQQKAAPQPLPINCPPRRFEPFKIDSDKFVNDDAALREIHQWYFGLEPNVRDTIETGATTVKITGRASTTASVDHNQTLGGKRADRVARILSGFGGSDSRMRAISLGELGAQTPDNFESAPERRVDVELVGQVPADRAGDVQGSLCEGHFGKTSKQGASGPVDGIPAPPSPDGNGASLDSLAATRPLLRWGSKGDRVRELQTLLNQLSQAGLSVDGDFGGGTLKAVKAFQQRNGLGADGIVGQQTWGSLLTVLV